MNINYQTINNLKVSIELLRFVNDELLHNTNISPKKFWSGFDQCIEELSLKNKDLLKIREDLQKKIDDWHFQKK